MPSLKDLRTRKKSVESTRKITSAMKMVAASKLRRAQDQALAARPYAEMMDKMVSSLSGESEALDTPLPLLSGTGKDHVHLVVVATSDRGLCGGFNSSIVKEARRTIQSLLNKGKEIKIICIGRKGRDQLRRDFSSHIIENIFDIGKPRLSFDDAQNITDKILTLFHEQAFDVCTIVYNKFKSAISQEVQVQQLIPLQKGASEAKVASENLQALYEFEPGPGEVLESLLPRNLSIQVYRALLENAASEQGARMAAMDNATRNAGDMIKKLTLTYNRARQAYITKELIEIISGAEAL